MCKVVKYWFACQHGFKLRHSKCGGTKHKSTRSGLGTACRSDAYLEFIFAVECGLCQHQAFEDGWKHKLKLADTFLDKLTEKGLPGVREVEALVEQLEEDFNTATWNTRTLFPHAHKEWTVRVSLGQFHRVPSPLSREVLPEDIPEPVEVIGPDHPDYKYDWDYVASTDPVHPVDTNYAQPLDEVDPAWLLSHLSPEEFEQSAEDVGFDASEVDMVWRDSLGEVYAETADCVEDTSGWTSEAAGFDQNQIPGDSIYAEAAERQIKVCAEDDRLLAERIDMVIQIFWRVVNETNTSDQVSRTMTSVLGDDLDDAFQGLHFSDLHGVARTPQTGLLTPPPTPPRLSTDGSCDSDASTSTPPNRSVDSAPLLTTKDDVQSLSAASQSAAVLTSSYYDRWRQEVTSIKDIDRARYNKELMYLSRREIKDVEGPNGRFVVDPQLPRDGDAKTGWLK